MLRSASVFQLLAQSPRFSAPRGFVLVLFFGRLGALGPFAAGAPPRAWGLPGAAFETPQKIKTAPGAARSVNFGGGYFGRRWPGGAARDAISGGAVVKRAAPPGGRRPFYCSLKKIKQKSIKMS